MEKLQFGMMYHIYNRGVNRCNIFQEKANYLYFLQLFSFHIAPIVKVYAYCLLPNHFHFLLQLLDRDDILKNPELRDFWKHTQADRPHQYFSNFFNAYARAFNERYGRTGSLFQRPFRRKAVTSQRYLVTLIRYIHQNPQNHGLVDDFRDWPYSSYDAVLTSKSTRVDQTTVLDWFGGAAEFVGSHETAVDEATIRHFIEM